MLQCPHCNRHGFIELEGFCMSQKVIALANWQAIKASGDDARQFLNSQLTCDLSSLEKDQASFACHCDAKGKLWAQSYLVNLIDSTVLFQHKSTIEGSLAELKKFAVFSKVSFSDSADPLKFYAWLNAPLDLLLHQVQEKDDLIVVRLSKSIHLIAATSPESVTQFTQQDIIEDESPFIAALSDDVIPFLSSAELQQKYVPQMLNAHALNAISFKKGCYMGQETVARMRFRGGQKKASFAFKSNANISTMATLEVALGDSWRRAGEVILSHYDKNSKTSRGIAVLPIDTDTQAQFRVKDDDSQMVQLSALPYSLDYEESK